LLRACSFFDQERLKLNPSYPVRASLNIGIGMVTSPIPYSTANPRQFDHRAIFNYDGFLYGGSVGYRKTNVHYREGDIVTLYFHTKRRTLHIQKNEGQMVLLDAKVSPNETFHPAVFFADSHDAQIQIVHEMN